jgi:hypothetical protein
MQCLIDTNNTKEKEENKKKSKNDNINTNNYKKEHFFLQMWSLTLYWYVFSSFPSSKSSY